MLIGPLDFECSNYLFFVKPKTVSAIKRLNPWAGLCECDTFVGGGCAPVQV